MKFPCIFAFIYVSLKNIKIYVFLFGVDVQKLSDDFTYFLAVHSLMLIVFFFVILALCKAPPRFFCFHGLTDRGNTAQRGDL